MSTHTKGPWHMSDRPNGPFWHIGSDHSVNGEPCKSGRQAIASVHAANKKFDPEYAAMFAANARLIAAAPELLEMLKNAYPFIEDRIFRARIGAVIAKAEGL